MILDFNVNGSPGAQGSKTVYGKGRFVESSKKVKPWRSDVKAAAEAAMQAGEWTEPHNGAVSVELIFRFRHPQSHYGTGRNAFTLKASAPKHPVSRALGDADKLARSTLDALVAAGVITDDSLVTTLVVHKTYGTGFPGAWVRVEALDVEQVTT